MHEVQTVLSNAKDLDDAQLLEAVVSGWETVCKENAEQEHLVSKAQFQQWTSFRQETSLKMHEIIDFSDDRVSDENRKYLESIASMIAGATHKSADQIKAENEAAALRKLSHEDAAENENWVQTKQERKSGLLSRLKKLFVK